MSSRRGELAMANILAIDDDSAVLATMKLLLERDGHSIVVANDSHKGLKIFETGNFDLLVVDIFMPKMDGLETVRLVHKRRPGIPIIVISGHAFPSDLNSTPDFLHMATRLGAITSLRKPFKPADLLATVARCLEASTNISGS
jgi:CheY-like chemotaxis protein